MKKASYEIDMVNGPLLGKIIRFAIPLMLSGILQLLFNAADIIVVGRFAGSRAMAAVGSTGSLNNLIINMFIGLSTGSSVLMSRYYGAHSKENIESLVHTSILIAALSGAVLVVIGIVLASPLLSMMGTPDDVLPLSVLYMRIIFCGMPAQMIYNFGAGLLRAVGDTKRPLAFLFTSGVINVIFNLFFVVVTGRGVDGVALATIISQYIAAFLVLRCLIKTDAVYKLTLSKLRLSKDKVMQIVRIGLPAGISGVVFSVSNVIIQSSVNSFGSITMAGNAAAQNIESFIYTAMNSLYQASINFTSQNYGAGKPDRIVRVLILCLVAVVAVGLTLGIIAMVFGAQLLSFYTSEADVIEYGLLRLNFICLMYILCGMMDVSGGSVRGLGYSITPTIVSLLGACALRIVWVYTIFRVEHSLLSLYVSYPISWALTFSLHIACFVVFHRRYKLKIRNNDHFNRLSVAGRIEK